jgi:hypothetical protein
MVAAEINLLHSPTEKPHTRREVTNAKGIEAYICVVTYMKVENVPETVLLVETFVDDLLSYRP